MGSKKEKGSDRRNNSGDFQLKKTIEIIERVKEIVKDCSDDEIYVMLQESNMNPDDAVQKLLLQDDFLEVKSKRERKKENKEASESRSQYLSSTSSHTLGHGGSTQYYSSDFEASGGKSTYKEEYRSNPSSDSSTYASGKEVRRSLSNNPGTQRQIWQRLDVIKSTQPLAGSHSACVGVSSPLTMAEILKIEKVKNNVSDEAVQKLLLQGPTEEEEEKKETGTIVINQEDEPQETKKVAFTLPRRKPNVRVPAIPLEDQTPIIGPIYEPIENAISKDTGKYVYKRRLQGNPPLGFLDKDD